MQNQEALVNQIIQSMQDIVVKHGLELMQHYPNDLLVHDKAHLMGMASPGAQFAWVVGDTHTHIRHIRNEQRGKRKGWIFNQSWE